MGTDVNPVVPPQPKRKKLWRIIRWSLLCLCIVVSIAWISLPTLDGPGRRQFANEATSVAKLRTINQLQTLYSATHRNEGFTCDLSRLKSGGAKDSRYDPDEFLVSGTQSGYKFVVVNCHADPTGAAAHYQIAAVPIELGKSGSRAFCTDDSGLLWYDKDGSATNCLAFRHPLE